MPAIARDRTYALGPSHRELAATGASDRITVLRLSLGVMLIALSTLSLELMLMRVFDVILEGNLAYFVVTMAVFGFGLAGIYATVRPVPVTRDIRGRLSLCSAAFAASIVLLIPLLNALPLDYRLVTKAPFVTIGAFLAMDLALLTAFFLSGYVLIAVFSTYTHRIQRLYFWDLIGAGLGTVAVIPLISSMGPGGILMCAGALGFVAAALFAPRRSASIAALAVAAALIAIPVMRGQDYIDFKYHMDKRGIVTALAQGRGEVSRWDPISKIDVIDETWTPAISKPTHRSGDRKAITYDGGNQTSYFYKFDGNFAALRAQLDHDKSHVAEHFWQLAVLAAHYLKRDSGSRVLVIGSAGGQETKAALVYGASHVDAVELVPTVVELGTTQYSPYIGNLFRDPRVNVQAKEGRSFLRSTDARYDIIQVYSNHTSSSIAAGNGALAPVYLQTAEAYQEYFSHLTPNGVLQVNHYLHPRMITTAALAWKRMGRTDFMRHVAVFYTPEQPSLPTLLIKMSPWTAEEIESLQQFLSPPELPVDARLTLVENPLEPGRNGHFLSPEFFSGNFPAALAERIPIDYTPRTDDRPYFSFARKGLHVVQPDPAKFVDPGSANVVSLAIIRNYLPADEIHLMMIGAASVFFVIGFIWAPLRYSRIGRTQGRGATPLLVYFSCLGAGFIIIELVLVQKFMQLIGSPLYTYSGVICSLLIAAGIGSAASEKLGIGPYRRWFIPFLGVLLCGSLLLAGYPSLSHHVLSWPLGARILASAVAIFPLGFFLGMPFPLGILAIERQPPGAVAWAWGMNGLFTIVGGLVSVLLGLKVGFNRAIVCALVLYAIALLVFKPLRASTEALAGSTPIRPDETAGSLERA